VASAGEPDKAQTSQMAKRQNVAHCMSLIIIPLRSAAITMSWSCPRPDSSPRIRRVYFSILDPEAERGGTSGATDPVRRQRWSSLIAQLTLTANCRAATPQESPPSTAATIRRRRSSEYSRPIPAGLRPVTSLNHIPTGGNPLPIPSVRDVLYRNHNGLVAGSSPAGSTTQSVFDPETDWTDRL
jgi:hypothetical protein